MFIEALKKFSTLSGLTINCEKTNAMWLGRWKNSNECPLGIKWSKEPIKVLGIYISTDPKKVIEYNYKSRLKKIKTLLNQWKQRNL